MSESFFLKRRTDRKQRETMGYHTESDKGDSTRTNQHINTMDGSTNRHINTNGNGTGTNYHINSSHTSTITNQHMNTTDTVIPDMPLIMPQGPITTKFDPSPSQLTIFGVYESRSTLLDELRQLGEITSVNHGRNYFSFSFEEPRHIDHVLTWNRRMVNGEIIGVYSNRVERGKIEKKGFLRGLLEYFFGPSRYQGKEEKSS